jgi:broad specificity phosphatase PhoE
VSGPELQQDERAESSALAIMRQAGHHTRHVPGATGTDIAETTRIMENPTRVCVVRHGETDWNTAGILQGWLDVPLNERGRVQARELAQTFAETGFTRVYTSPLHRSLETAEIIAERLGLPPPVCHDGLKERNFGVIQGIPKSELAELNPALMEHILKRNPDTSFEQGESMDEFATRVRDAVMEIAVAVGGERVLLITHGWVMDAIAREVAGLPRSTILHRKPKNGESLWLDATSRSIRPVSGLSV